MFWADRATTRRHSPFYYMAHGIGPVLLFDIILATFLVPNLTNKISTVELLATRARSSKGAKTISRQSTQTSWRAALSPFERQHKNTIRDYDFGPGAFVLVRNLSMETDLGCKAKPCYIGPMVVLCHTQNGSYRLRARWHSVEPAFCGLRLVPYHAHSCSSIPVTRLVN